MPGALDPGMLIAHVVGDLPDTAAEVALVIGASEVTGFACAGALMQKFKTRSCNLCDTAICGPAILGNVV